MRAKFFVVINFKRKEGARRRAPSFFPVHSDRWLRFHFVRRYSHLTPAHIDKYVAWLRLKYPGRSTARGYFSQLKSLVSSMHEIGLVKKDPASLFPANPFPGTRSACEGETPLSAAEMQRLSESLKKDLIAIHHKKFEGSDSQAISLLLLMVAMRLGVNTTSLLEMRRDCLRPHPFMPNLMLVDTIKRRGSGAQSTGLRKPQDIEEAESISMDGVAILKKALAMTEELAVAAPNKIKDLVWLYKAPKNKPTGKNISTLSLSEAVFGRAVREAMQRHQILADDGGPLRVTLSRLRKTKETRLWRLSDGDLLAVASAMGHSPQVADNHYLRLDEDTKANAAIFIMKELPGKLRGEAPAATPTGRCQDTLNGALAPHDGSTHCANFTQCLTCPSYAIAGTVEDLHRLFSFQAFLQIDLSSYEGEEWVDWRLSRQSMIEQITLFTTANFPASLIAKAREKTNAGLHPFWAIQARKRPTIGGLNAS